MEPIFPGMDPYLEARGVWPDFHDRFLAYATETLQPGLPKGHYALLRDREEIGIAGFEAETVFFPDVAVKKAERTERTARAAGTAKTTLYLPPAEGQAASGTATVPERLIIAKKEGARVNFLEVRDTTSGDRLVTRIELLSPSNKVLGPDRDAFLREQGEVLGSEANWIEIDLLRDGKRIACHPSVGPHLKRRGYDYSVVVSRASRRAPELELEIYGFRRRDLFPTIGIPLSQPHADVPLDLGRVFHRTYTTGPYPMIARYETPLDPPLLAETEEWVRALLEARGLPARTERG